MCIPTDFPPTTQSSPRLRWPRTLPRSPGTCGRSATRQAGSRSACVSGATPALWTSSTPTLTAARCWGPSTVWRSCSTESGTSWRWVWRAARQSCWWTARRSAWSPSTSRGRCFAEATLPSWSGLREIALCLYVGSSDFPCLKAKRQLPLILRVLSFSRLPVGGPPADAGVLWSGAGLFWGLLRALWCGESAVDVVSKWFRFPPFAMCVCVCVVLKPLSHLSAHDSVEDTQRSAWQLDELHASVCTDNLASRARQGRRWTCLRNEKGKIEKRKAEFMLIFFLPFNSPVGSQRSSRRAGRCRKTRELGKYIEICFSSHGNMKLYMTQDECSFCRLPGVFSPLGASTSSCSSIKS